MPHVPRPVLWWSSQEDGSGVLSAVLTDKHVWLHGRGVRQQTPFRILRRNLLARIPHLGRRLFGAWVSDIPTVYLGNGAMRSETYWQATSLALPPASTDYYFTDANGGTSGSLAVVNTPTLQWTMARYAGGGLRPRADVILSSNGYARAELGQYGRSYEVHLSGEILAPQDPEVEIEVLEPGTSQELLLKTAEDVLHHELASLAEEQSLGVGHPSSYQHFRYLAPALRHIDSFLGRRYVDFVIHGESRFTATADTSHPVSLTVRGDEPVRLLFAIQIRDRHTGSISISEFMPVIIAEPRLG